MGDFLVENIPRNGRTARDCLVMKIEKSCTARDCRRFWSENGRTARDGWNFLKNSKFREFFKKFVEFPKNPRFLAKFFRKILQFGTKNLRF